MFRRSASLNVPRFVISRCLPSQIYVHICRICLVGSIEGFSPESEAFLHDPLHEEIHQSKTEQHYDFRCEICINMYIDVTWCYSSCDLDIHLWKKLEAMHNWVWLTKSLGKRRKFEMMQKTTWHCGPISVTGRHLDGVKLQNCHLSLVHSTWNILVEFWYLMNGRIWTPSLSNYFSCTFTLPAVETSKVSTVPTLLLSSVTIYNRTFGEVLKFETIKFFLVDLL